MADLTDAAIMELLEGMDWNDQPDLRSKDSTEEGSVDGEIDSEAEQGEGEYVEEEEEENGGAPDMSSMFKQLAMLNRDAIVLDAVSSSDSIPTGLRVSPITVPTTTTALDDDTSDNTGDNTDKIGTAVDGSDFGGDTAKPKIAITREDMQHWNSHLSEEQALMFDRAVFDQRERDQPDPDKSIG